VPAGREGGLRGSKTARRLAKARGLLPAAIRGDSKQRAPGISARNSSRTAVSADNRTERGSSTNKWHSKETLRTYDGKVGAGSDARDDVGGDALPLAVVVLAEGADLQGAAGQRVVLAPAGLPYLGHGQGGSRAKREKTRLRSALRGRARRRRGH